MLCLSVLLRQTIQNLSLDLFWLGVCRVVLPMPIIQMLAYKCVRLHCAIIIHSWHVHVIYKVDQPSVTYRGVASACSFL